MHRLPEGLHHQGQSKGTHTYKPRYLFQKLKNRATHLLLFDKNSNAKILTNAISKLLSLSTNANASPTYILSQILSASDESS